MTFSNRTARYFVFFYASTFVFFALSFLSRVSAQAPFLQPQDRVYAPVPGGVEEKIVSSEYDFTNEEYDVIEALCEVPDGESAKFYQECVEALRANRAGLFNRWYRQRAAQLIPKIDEALKVANARFNAALAEERRAIFERYNTLARQGDPDALLEFIREYDKPAPKLTVASLTELYSLPKPEWTPAPNSLIAQMYETYYRLRIQKATRDMNPAAIKDVVDEIVASDNPHVAQLIQNLVEYVALYDRDQAERLDQTLDDARAREAQKNGWTYKSNRAAEAPLIYVDSPTQKAMKKFFVVPDGRDLDFYRQLLQQFSNASPETPDDDQIVREFRALRQQALEKTLRHIVLMSNDAIEGVNPVELERYRTVLFENADYPAAIELQKLDLLPPESYSQLRKTVETYFARLIASGQYVDIDRRREIIKEFADAAEKYEIIFQVYENFFGRDVDDRTSEFAKELRAAICEAGLKSENPGPYTRAKKMSEPPKPAPETYVGRTVDLRGLDVNEAPFDMKSCDGKPVILVLSTSADWLFREFDRLSSSRIGSKLEGGEAAFVGYLVKSRADTTRFNGNLNVRYDFTKSLPKLRAAVYPILAEYYSSDSNAEDGTDYPMLGDQFLFKNELCLVLGADGKIIGAFNPMGGESSRDYLWKLEQLLDNLLSPRSSQ